MTELTRPARALLNAAQVARTPNDRDRERIFAAMLAASMTSNNPPPMREKESVLITGLTQPVAPAPIPSFPAPARPSTRPAARPDVTETLPPKRLARPGLAWIAATAVAAVIGVGSYFAVASGKSSPAAAQSEVTEVQVNAADEPAPAAAAPEPAAQAPQAAAPSAPPSVVQLEDVQASAPKAAKSEDDGERHSARKSSSSSRSNSKDDGARVLFAAERAFRMGQATRAFEIVKAHEKKYPKSSLKVERNALRAQLLCELGKPKAARKVVLELEADRVSDHVLASVDQSCAESASHNNNL